MITPRLAVPLASVLLVALGALRAPTAGPAPLAAGPAAAAVVAPAPAPDPAPVQDDADAMAAAMAKAARYTQPGEHHALLERFLGTWDTQTHFVMGGRKTPPEAGTATTRWLIAGRWIETRTEGQMMGNALESVSIMGYDNFKMSYVATSVSSMDTAMNRSEGDLDPGGEALLLYGTLDEYLTGEHDKMVKTVYRFISEDEYVMEIHDLPIGEKNTQVVEIRFTRAD